MQYGITRERIGLSWAIAHAARREARSRTFPLYGVHEAADAYVRCESKSGAELWLVPPIPAKNTEARLQALYRERQEAARELLSSLRRQEEEQQRIEQLRSRLAYLDGNLAEIDDLLSLPETI